jgi:hypothetical protein
MEKFFEPLHPDGIWTHELLLRWRRRWPLDHTDRTNIHNVYISSFMGGDSKWGYVGTYVCTYVGMYKNNVNYVFSSNTYIVR